MPQRPAQTRIQDELGQSRTLARGREAFSRLKKGRQVLVLGLGPDPGCAPGAEGPGWFIECPDFVSRMSGSQPGNWNPPTQWRELSALSTDILAEAKNKGLDLRQAEIWLYTQGPRLFPSFWGPVLARLQRALHPGDASSRREVLLPGRQDGLLLRELEHAFTSAGYAVRRVEALTAAESTPSILAEGRPSLVFCVNFQGLDAYGQAYHYFREAGCKVAAWCVDNPWHLLSGLKAPFWKDMPLFVTDASFVAPLQAHGAGNVHHLPLAADPGLFYPRLEGEPIDADLAGKVVFVGRSEFPAKSGFFAGCRLDPGLWKTAQSLTASGGRADFHWWLDSLGLEDCWPGKQMRPAGYGAEESGRAFRAETLRFLAREFPLMIYGDAGWKDLLPGTAELRPPVDYYGSLKRVYQSAALNINCTSPLLPAGLTQRHFDVWAAGGLLLSDATPGLDIFPRDLVEPIVFKTPGEAPAVARRLLDSGDHGRELARQWRGNILERHTYRQRVEFILRVLNMT